MQRSQVFATRGYSFPFSKNAAPVMAKATIKTNNTNMFRINKFLPQKLIFLENLWEKPQHLALFPQKLIFDIVNIRLFVLPHLLRHKISETFEIKQ
jgi:hypothetical protein